MTNCFIYYVFTDSAPTPAHANSLKIFFALLLSKEEVALEATS